MTIQELQELLEQNPMVVASRKIVTGEKHFHLLLSGLYGSARASVLAAIAGREHTMLVVMDNADEALYLNSDLQTIGAKSLYFPSGHRRRQTTDEDLMIQRTEVLSHLSNPQAEPIIVVTYPEALSEPVAAPQELAEKSIHVKRGDTLQIANLSERLTELGFVRQDFVFEPGQYAVRGGIVDIYSYSNDDPYRLDFFGDEIDSIRTFDIENQLSKERVETAEIVNMAASGRDAGCARDGGSDRDAAASGRDASCDRDEASLYNYLPAETIYVGRDCSPYAAYCTIELNQRTELSPFTQIRFETETQPTFLKKFDLLREDLERKINDGYRIYIAADQKKQTDRLQQIFSQISEPTQTAITFTPIDHTIHEGWVDRKNKIAVYTDHQIFERYHRVMRQRDNARRGKAIITLREINGLSVGDYVVHSDHGIGQFGGLVTTSVNGRKQEMIRINFRGGDFIFVSIHNLHRISKYKGKEGNEPTISRLGSGAWERLKERTKDRVKEIARDLIQLYATRKQQPGFAYSPDSYMQQELEASFLYEDTPDQAKATIDVKRDMESPKPMDRLICGDVGFGKTEIAMRAAFKAATDGKQVAILVPTTVLALQHYNTLRERFSQFPVNIDYLSRAKTARETKEILERIANGKTDIVVGTHKLVGKNVKWHDLGLLIIDEEQKFGVAVKEKLKQMRANIDVLTLTATPIPRTLQFSLLGARDLSVMTTPPPNRYPVQTELIGNDDDDIIREAIQLEMGRNGQIFVVSNRIEMLPRIADRLKRLCPEARICIAHGQMPSDEMEQRLEDFINYDYDILVSTTIIESGVDIPNVNTIIIYSAQHYGLSDLHQLRGRVGRSNRKAYCYLVTPDRELITADAKRRLEALEIFSELGSGFNLAMQDLDIRGAGNMLGSEQSGFIADLGYETYQRILQEAIEELKDEAGCARDTACSRDEAADGTWSMEYGPQPMAADGVCGQWPRRGEQPARNWVNDSQLETDLPLCFPSTYIENITERITLYKELDSIGCEEQLTQYQKRLIDRFGVLPPEAEELLQVVRLRWLCCRLGIEKIYLKQQQMTIYLPQKNERYYQSDEFSKILGYVMRRIDRCRINEEIDKKTGQKTGKRWISIRDVKTVAGAMHLLNSL